VNSRVLAAVAAAVLAIAGTFLLIAYTNGAEQRALAGVQTAEVLIISAAVPAGTPGDVVLQSASKQAVPRPCRLTPLLIRQPSAVSSPPWTWFPASSS
jgi:pilus assembly protein CpaB